MALTLDAALAAAQGLQNRRPLVDIEAAGAEMEVLPMPAFELQSSAEYDQHPNALMLSNGRIVVVYAVDASAIRFGLSDAERLELSFQTILTGSEVDSPAIVERPDGKIGMLYLERGANNLVKWAVLAASGGVEDSGTVANYGSSDWMSEPFVILLSSGTYLAVWTVRRGLDYDFQTSTSTDFETWTTVATPSVSGLLVTRHLDHPSLVQLDTDDVFMWFDYVNEIDENAHEISNIFYSISTDDGSTWGGAVQATFYDTAIITAEHPIAFQDDTASQFVAFTEKTTALHKSSAGEQYEDVEWCGAGGATTSSVRSIGWDWVNRKVYCINGETRTWQQFRSVIKMDLDTWEIDDCWSYTSDGYDPGYHGYFGKNPCDPPGPYGNFCSTNVGLWNTRQGRNIIAVASDSSYYGDFEIGIAVLDGENDWIRHYWNWQRTDWGVEPNLAVIGEGTKFIDIDQDRMKMWIWTSGYLSAADRIGYIDLTQTVPDPFYDFNQFTTRENSSATDFRIYEDLDMMIIGGNSYVIVYSISEGGTTHSFGAGSPGGEDWPAQGIRKLCYMDNAIWGTIDYLGETDDYKHGLIRCDLDTGEVSMHNPFAEWGYRVQPWRVEPTQDHELVMTGGQYGFYLYDTQADEWLHHDNSSVAGLLPGNPVARVYALAYDEATGTMIGGANFGQTRPWQGVIAVNRYGLLRSNQYFNITYDGGWTVGATSQLTDGIADFHASPVQDPDEDFLYAFWTRQVKLDYDLYWGREGTELITPFLIGEVKKTQSIEGEPSELSFSLGRGHLFDPYHTTSLLSPYMQRGAKLYLRFGESVYEDPDWVEYWQDMGTFYIDNVKLKHERGTYPTMQVVAKDLIMFMEEDQDIFTQEYVDTYPQYVLQDVLETHGNLDPNTEILLPELMENQAYLSMQWTEEDLMDIIEDICDRFGYYWRVNVDGKFTIRYINDDIVTNPVDHVYSDSTRLLHFTPDYQMSDWTNRVIIKGESLEWEDVIHQEEPVVESHGTFGWWGFKKTFTHYYSPDKRKRCVEPRLEKIEDAANSFIFDMLGNVYMKIVSSTDTYVVVKVEATDLTGALITAIAAALGSLLIPDLVITFGVYATTGTTLPFPGSAARALAFAVVFEILSSIGNYQYRVHARPVTEIRREFSVIVDDLDLQYEIGRIIAKSWDDPLCYTISQAQWRAEREMKMLQWQRKRVNFSKITHLQDEEGDMITVPHPYTGETMRIFVTKLTRKFRYSAKGGRAGGGGYFIDDMEGWIVG